MKKTFGLAPFALAAGVSAAILLAPTAGAAPNCEQTGDIDGGATTECTDPGNAQITTSPGYTQFLYPWGDMFYGPAMMMGW